MGWYDTHAVHKRYPTITSTYKVYRMFVLYGCTLSFLLTVHSVCTYVRRYLLSGVRLCN